MSDSMAGPAAQEPAKEPGQVHERGTAQATGHAPGQASGEEPGRAPGTAGPGSSSYDPAPPRPLGVERAPTGNAEVDARLARLADADHLTADGHIEVYEDVHRGLRDTLTGLDARPAPQGPPGPAGPQGPRGT
ncbi:hypothetical protein ACIOJD_30815 [Streptomyces sp. NPDC088116]|uniref:hypothetical protein n=1 Tax=Streptomyces sp. NPDC088116 TaxID=3365825 RepID=UPI0038118B84